MPDRLRFELRLPAHPSSVGVARAVARSLPPPAASEPVTLAVSELVTNSIRHAGTGPADVVELVLDLGDDGVTGTVRDRGPAFSLPCTAPDPIQTGGFGLYIVGQVAELHVDRFPGGNAVSFHVGAGRGQPAGHCRSGTGVGGGPT